jgi:hypothetical protein
MQQVGAFVLLEERGTKTVVGWPFEGDCFDELRHVDWERVCDDFEERVCDDFEERVCDDFEERVCDDFEEVAL